MNKKFLAIFFSIFLSVNLVMILGYVAYRRAPIGLTGIGILRQCHVCAENLFNLSEPIYGRESVYVEIPQGVTEQELYLLHQKISPPW